MKLLDKINLRESIPYLIMSVIVFISRVPFLTSGYGYDTDAWLVVHTSKQIAETGKYMFSRPPGYPVYEFIYSLLWNKPYWVLNGITAVFSVLAIVFFALILREVGSKNSRLGALALAFTPIVYINSTNSMDYIWALCFILGSMYFALKQHAFGAGLMLGIAIGIRITSATMLIPFAIILSIAPLKVHRLSVFAITTAVVGGAFFAIVFAEYQFSFFRFADPAFPIKEIIIRAIGNSTVRVWGGCGFITIIVAAAIAIHNKLLRNRTRDYDRYTIALTVAIILSAIPFFRLPLEPGYLIPTVAMFLLLLDYSLSKTQYAIMCLCLILSSWVFAVEVVRSSSIESRYSTEFTIADREITVALPGPILIDHNIREKETDSIQLVTEIVAAQEGNFRFAVGPLRTKIMHYLALKEEERLPALQNQIIEYYEDDDLAKEPLIALYYLDTTRQKNISEYGIDPEALGAIAISVD